MNWPWNKRKPEREDKLPPAPLHPRKLVLAPTHVRVLVCSLERFVGPALDSAGFDQVYYEPGTVLEHAQALRPDVVMLDVRRGEEAHTKYLETVRRLRELKGCADLPVVVFRIGHPADDWIDEAPGVARINIPFAPEQVPWELRRVLDVA